ncbi:MAG: FG-GAP repeat domain-containing protein [Bacteroidota bacterium]
MRNAFVLFGACLGLLVFVDARAQLFTRVTEISGLLAMNGTTQWGNGVSFFDVDEDGWDDITICIANAPTRYYKNVQGVYQLQSFFPNVGDTKSCTWSDFDNDGLNDLLITSKNTPIQLFHNIGDGNFIEISDSLDVSFNTNLRTWGAAMGDPDRDGDLDMYIANYGFPTARNTFLINSNLHFAKNEISGLTNYIKNTFQPVWCDLDQDLNQDMHLINDRATRNDYFKQIAPLIFSDQSMANGLGVSLDAMSNSFCDFDNDGDLDLYITNINGNYLMRQDSTGQFSNVALDYNVKVNEWSWSGLWLDIQNDGWQDLFVTTEDLGFEYPTHHSLFLNNESVFTENNTEGILQFAHGHFAAVKGDYNNDGSYDIVLSPESNKEFELFRNNKLDSNHFLKFRLEGRCSNRNGWGTRYEYYMGGQKSMGYTVSGDNYIAQNSQNIILSLGEHTQVDSLKLFWLSGVEDVFYNLPADSMYVLVEGDSKDDITASQIRVCNSSEEVHLALPNWPIMIWENGDTSNTRVVYGPGMYSVQLSTGFGRSFISNIEITLAQTPEILTQVTPISCFGSADGQVELIDFNSGTSLFFQDNLGPGIHTFTYNSLDNCPFTEQIELLDPDSLYLQSNLTNPDCHGNATGELHIAPVGGHGPYLLNNEWNNEFELDSLQAGAYTIEIQDANGCSVAQDFELIDPLQLQASISVDESICPGDSVIPAFEVSGGTGAYNFTPPIAYLGAGAWSFTITDDNACSTTVSAQITEEEQFNPQVYVQMPSWLEIHDGSIVVDSLLCNGCSIFWNTGDTVWSLFNLTEGAYAFDIITPSGCSASGEVFLMFNNLNQLNNLPMNWTHNANGFLNLGKETQHQVMCFDASGKLVGQANQVGPMEYFSISNLANGIYFILTHESNWKVPVYDLK